MDSGKNGGRVPKTRYSDTSVPFKSFIDPSEFPLVDNWENADRQTSLNGITDSSLSSGFASDLSSAAAPSTRFPSFSLASMESLEAADSTWFNSFDPNAAPSTTTSSVTAESSKRANKNGESNNSGQKKNRRFVDARQRSGSMAAGTISTNAQNNQNVQRSMSFSVPMLGTGAYQFNAKGNIFRQRKDFSVFERLQAWKRNGYFIQLEDDSCTGNEDTRAFVLCQLTCHGASEVPCLACSRSLPVYDHFPLLDGALFLSPVCHRGGLQVSWNVPAPTSTGSSSSAPGGHVMHNDLAPPPGCTGPRQQQVQQQSHHHGFHGHNQGRHRASVSQKRFLHAVCMSCTRSIDPERRSLEGSTDALPQIVCKFCKSPWNGSTLLIGGLYTYDLFACSPCCINHLSCKSCGLQPLSLRSEFDTNEDTDESMNKLRPLPYFSQYSHLLCCQHCRAVDYHFIKPFDEVYEVRIDSSRFKSRHLAGFIKVWELDTVDLIYLF
ncbi:unnamed protein product [Hymenolepis diminuta]|uniref:Headcase domain-containing protein n=1 Tax=Hymenolepis diminuta TaxID=6216 RepID=A0A158QCB5_HYMDI|nr:unnamed protein product [Hymenolepis diminuta]